jgi:hypothetical protein
MLRRAARAAFILFQFVLLNVALPGHTRGVITLPGYKPDRHEVASCCTGHASKSNSPEQAPSERDRAHCAVCFFAATVCVPPVHDLRLTELGLADLLPVPPPVVADSIEFRPTYLGRAPPIA